MPLCYVSWLQSGLHPQETATSHGLLHVTLKTAAGPLKTLAAKSIPGFSKFEDVWTEKAPLGWDVKDSSAVAKACCALLSDWFPMTTGTMIHVDGGFRAMGA